VAGGWLDHPDVHDEMTDRHDDPGPDAIGHHPVMVAEVLEQLAPSRGGTFVDCTVGLGGHARVLLDAGATRLIGLDRDPAALERARGALAAYGDRVELVHSDYRSLPEVLGSRGIATVSGILADLGVSSLQLDAPGRGFSFRRDDPLDMRMDTSRGPTAAEALAEADERTLADVIYEFGEERHARRVARAIVAAREAGPIETTGRLADIVRRAIPRKGYVRIDPATRTFQAIRIWVNGELDGLDEFLGRAADALNEGGRLVVITFHSLEDRIVKHTLRSLQAAGRLTIRTKRPLVPTEAEIDRNPRARSAKLRAAERSALVG
jgi:16S rRNA (cytosine1402-N4)-methyltransferase